MKGMIPNNRELPLPLSPYFHFLLDFVLYMRYYFYSDI